MLGPVRNGEEGCAGGGGTGVEEGLQDEDGGNLVDDSAMAGAREACGVEVAMRFGGGEALVPEVDREAGLPVQVAGKLLSFDSLGAEVAGHVEGIPDHDCLAGIAAGEASEGAEIVPEIGAGEGQDGLGG